MSIRYTIRHNIPHEKIEAEDVNDSSTWDLNLIRKHELAETDEHDIVYRQHDGKIVSWAKAATQHAQEISDQVDERFNEITTEAALLELKLQEVEEEASALTEEAHEAVESANIAVIKAETAKQESKTNAENSEQNYFLAKDWATKTNGKVIENEEEVDYSSKYYAQQAASSAQSASNYASQAQQAATTSAEQAAQNVSDLLSGYVTSAQASASTATEKAEEASESASDALQAKQDAISASGDAISARNTAIDAKDTAVSAANSASNSATSAQTSASSASSSAATAANKATSASNSATTATTKATEASESATSASASATSAQTSANTASAKATEASGFASNAQESANDSQDYSDLSKDWATKTDGMVGSEDYSSKYYAQQAEDAAERTVEDTQQLLQTYVVSATNSATIASNKAGEAQQILEDIESRKDYYGIPIGYEYFSMNPNVPQGSLPLFGGEYARDTYSDLWAWVQTQTGYLKTEAEWQTLSASNNGNVPYYSSGDGSTTFRVPSLKCWVKSANGTISEVGSYLEAGLPNITGSYDSIIHLNPTFAYDCFGLEKGKQQATGTTSGTNFGPQGHGYLSIDASRSSSIYGNSTTVQPESIVGMWLVKAYGTIVDTGSIDEQAYIDEKFAQAKQYTDIRVPTGCVQAFAGNTLPDGWLLCDGSAVDRTLYAALFTAIGTTYGSGDGSSTFNLPNLTDRFIQGNATSGAVKNAGLPNITGTTTHSYRAGDMNLSKITGAFKWEGLSNGGRTVYDAGSTNVSYDSFDASRSNSIYGKSNTVQPPALTMRYIIKY